METEQQLKLHLSLFLYSKIESRSLMDGGGTMEILEWFTFVIWKWKVLETVVDVQSECLRNIKKLRGHWMAIYCFIFGGSGRNVISGFDDRLVKIWSLETAFGLASCLGHEADITDLAIL
ncbi:hypothetical protein VNO78_32228 [Psophocarpus tetragonolobus]|uniref:Uncharacterized protein n=1 Tax=Psophocarpus tetragonolobus TaxID=3891 RepID=A0AAN9RS28_PSOTE